MIWEAHYSQVEGNFGFEKIVVVLQKLRQDFSKYIRTCTSYAIVELATKKKGMYTPLPTPDRP
jgi:hypothetical protein